MKFLPTLCSLLSVAMFLSSAQIFADEIILDSKISEVTVYPTQAQVTRTAKLELQAGEHSLVFENIPLAANTASFRTSATGPAGLTLLGMEQSRVFHTEAINEKVAALEREINRLLDEVKSEMDDRLDVFNQQKKFLIAIAHTSTKNMTEQINSGGVKVAEWRSAYSFISVELRAVNDSIRIVSLQLEQVNIDLKKLRQEQGLIRNSQSNTSLNLQVNVNLQNAGSVTVELQYVIAGASWYPLYDARMSEETGKVKLNYLADVTQNTGEDWNDVKLSLSTSRPSSGTGPGELATWALASVRNTEYGALRMNRKNIALDTNVEFENYELADVALAEGMVSGLSVAKPSSSAIKIGTYSTTFSIKRQENIPSGNKSVRTTIGSWPLQSEIELICRPKNRKGVYRQVTLTNQENAPLMPGDVSIFVAADFLGNTQLIDLVSPKQEFELPFGLENTIAVEREIEDYKTDRNSTRVRIDQTIKITLTNNGADSVSSKLEEPLPVSQNKQIKVKIRKTEPTPIPSEDKSKATWTVLLAAGEEKTITLAIRIEHPLYMRVAGL